MRDKPRLLIVENEDALRDRLARIMAEPPAAWLVGTVLAGFDVAVAGNVAEAQELLSKAKQDGTPFEVVLLDLSLPATEEDARLGREAEGHGLESRSRNPRFISHCHRDTDRPYFTPRTSFMLSGRGRRTSWSNRWWNEMLRVSCLPGWSRPSERPERRSSASFNFDGLWLREGELKQDREETARDDGDETLSGIKEDLGERLGGVGAAVRIRCCSVISAIPFATE